MAQIIQIPDVGTALGTGLNEGLQNLAAIKLREIQQRKEREMLAPALKKLGLEGLEALPAPLLGEVLKQRFKQQETARYNQALGLLTGEQAPVSEITPAMQAVLQPEEPTPAQFSIPEVLQAAGISPLFGQAAQAVAPTISPTKTPSIAEKAIAPEKETKLAAELPKQREIIPQKLPTDTDIARIAKQANLSPQQHQNLRKEAADKRKEQLEERKLAFKESKALRDEEYKDEKLARKSIEDAHKEAVDAKEKVHELNRILDLTEKGELSDAAYVEFLKSIGLDLPAMMNADDEELGKLIQGFMGGARTAVGGKVSNYELEQFMKSIPSQSQSPEGRKRVAANMKRIYQMKTAYYDSMRDIIREHGGRPPRRLLELVYEDIDKRTDKIAKAFKKDLARPVPAGPSGLKIAAAKAGGTALKNIPRAAGQAAAGAGLGYKYGGPYGALAGGALGGLAGLGGFGASDILKGIFG